MIGTYLVMVKEDDGHWYPTGWTGWFMGGEEAVPNPVRSGEAMEALAEARKRFPSHKYAVAQLMIRENL